MTKGPLARLSLAVLCLAVGWPVLAADLYKDIHAHPELSFQETRNDDARAARSGGVLEAAFDERARQLSEPGSASEDYSEFVIAGVPSFYFGIGGLDPKVVAGAAANKTLVPGNHSPEFAPVPKPSVPAPRP
jgi:metal-dependent amidase/aminoacylase/carboxypeptidase family protein